MTWGFVAVGAGSLVGGYLSGEASKDAANTAAGAQTAASQAGIEETRRQFDTIQKLLDPYVQAGTSSLTQQQDLLGTNGIEAQQKAIGAIQNGPEFAALSQQGENSILQNASATGGLRGGNVNGALGQFRPKLLNELIQQQFQRLGGMTNLGQNSAVGVGNAALQTGQNVSSLFGDIGAANAGSALATGQANADMYGGIGQTVSTLGMLKLLGAFNKSGTTATI